MKPFFSIWVSPRKTFEYLSTRDDSTNSLMINILSVFITIGLLIPRLKEFSNLFASNKIPGVLMGVFIGGLSGLLVIKLLLSLIYWGIGKLFKGKATKNQIQLVVAYSMIPYLIYLVIGLVLIIPAIVTKNFDLVFYRHPFTFYVVWILTLRNLIFGLSYFNNYSYGLALLNILIPTGITELIRLIFSN